MLERKVWIKTSRGPLYPNMYTVLVAPPGVGKGVSLSTMDAYWRGLKDLKVAPTSLTKAAIVDALRDAQRHIISPTALEPYLDFNSLQVISPELGVLLPSWENDMMNTLTQIYDGVQYDERRRTNALKFEIPRPQINLLAATTPNYLQHLLPEGAWNQGFTSRVLFVYAGQQPVVDLFAENAFEEVLDKNLRADLSVIFNRVGAMRMEPSAQTAFTNWHLRGGPPQPDHPKLEHYLTRRSAHLLKLMMVVAHARAEGDSFTIYMHDYQKALDWFLEVEAQIPDIFRSMSGSGSDAQTQEELWHFVFKLYAKSKQPVPEHKLVAFLRERVPSHNVMKILEIMVRSEIFRESIILPSGVKAYTPAPRQA